MKQPPIEEQEFSFGHKRVIEIGDLRVARGLTRRPIESCKHNNTVYDTTERRIWCKDCEQEVDAFDAFINVVKYHYAAANVLEKRANQLKEVEQFTLRLRATRALERIWRGKLLPRCASCGAGMFANDYVNPSKIGKEFALAQIQKKKSDHT